MPMNIDALTNRKESDVYKLLGAVLQARYPELVSSSGIPVNISNVSEPKYGGIFKKTIELPQQLTKEQLSNDVLAAALNSVLHEYKHGKDAAADLGTAFGMFIVRRIEALRNKPQKAEIDLDVL